MTGITYQVCEDSRCGVHGRGAVRDDSIVCARAILRAYDRPGAIALLEQEPTQSAAHATRTVLPLRHDGPVAPGALWTGSFVVGTRFRAGKVYVTASAQSEWTVHDIRLGGRSQIAPHLDLPGVLFAGGVQGARGIAYDEIPEGGLVEVVLRNASDTPQIPYVTVVGDSTSTEHAISLASEQDVPVSSLSRGGIRTVSAIAELALSLHRIVIEGDDAYDWIVADIRINGATQLAGPGDIPGDMFNTNAIDAFIKLGDVEAGQKVELDVFYIGESASRPFRARMMGTRPSNDQWKAVTSASVSNGVV